MSFRIYSPEMPVFHTKTIESILEPVSKQVAQLVILHEEGADGNALPPLDAPIGVVQKAVANLQKVGEETVQESSDLLLKRDMPPALDMVQVASESLGKAAMLISADPFSVEGREILIKGARGILQGTSDLLLAFDQGEVRKLIKQVRAVLDYIGLADQVIRMEDVVTFLKSLSPSLTRVGQAVRARGEELTSLVHRDLLIGALERAINLSPQLISGLKLFVNTAPDDANRAQAAEQRDLAQVNMQDELREVIRVLQLVHYDVHGWEPISLAELKRLNQNLDEQMVDAKRWIADTNAPPGGEGERRAREAAQTAAQLGQAAGAAGAPLVAAAQKFGVETEKLAGLRNQGVDAAGQKSQQLATLQSANEVEEKAKQAMEQGSAAARAYHKVRDNWQAAQQWLADSSAPSGPGSKAVGEVLQAGKSAGALMNAKDKAEMDRLAAEGKNKLTKLEKLRDAQKGETAEAQKLAMELKDDLDTVSGKVAQIAAKPSSDIPMASAMDKLGKLFRDPLKDDGSGVRLVRKIISDARQLARFSEGPIKEALIHDANHAEDMTDVLDAAIKNQDAAKAKNAAAQLEPRVDALKNTMEEAAVAALATEFSDTSSALKALSNAAYQPMSNPNRNQLFAAKAAIFAETSSRLAGLGRLAAPQVGTEKEIKEANKLSARLEEIAPAIVKAGRIVLQDPENKPAKEHFELLKEEWTQAVDKLAANLDSCADAGKLVRALELQMIEDQKDVKNHVSTNDVARVLPSAGNMARRAHRVLMVAKREAENSEDPVYVNNLKQAFNVLNTKVQPMIMSAKGYAQNQNPDSSSTLVNSGEDLIAAVSAVREAMEPPKEPDFPAPPSPPPAYGSGAHGSSGAPQVPDDPNEGSAPPVPPEYEEEFPSDDSDADQDIYLPAKELFDEVNKWMAKGNSLIDAAKKMALLMAEMSRLVQEGGDKRELIRCAHEIVKYGQLVAKLSREISAKCTDKRIKNNMTGSSQNIETIATQFRILSTVKATMLNAKDVSDDEAAQAHEMLVHNAQNLMKYVKEVVREANAANIKIRADTGLTIKWIPKDQQVKQRRRKTRKSQPN